jgi:hypothetical protein
MPRGSKQAAPSGSARSGRLPPRACARTASARRTGRPRPSAPEHGPLRGRVEVADRNADRLAADVARFSCVIRSAPWRPGRGPSRGRSPPPAGHRSAPPQKTESTATFPPGSANAFTSGR